MMAWARQAGAGQAPPGLQAFHACSKYRGFHDQNRALMYVVLLRYSIMCEYVVIIRRHYDEGLGLL